MNSELYIDIPLNLIQSIRVVHSLMESDHIICVHTEYESVLSYLANFFHLNFRTFDSNHGSKIVSIEISHELPRTRIGSIERPLIFPHGAFQYCRDLWHDDREYKFAFAGLVNEKRRATIRDWLQKKWPTCNCNYLTDNQFYLSKFGNLKEIFLSRFNLFGLPGGEVKRCGDFFLWSSDRGRRFPVKIWDTSYFKFLANSQFVICLDGDFVWTYRFFESIMCGAVPVVQNDSSIYQGFRYKHMDSPIEDMIWDKCDAEFNFRLCQERLTVPIKDINNELARLLNSDLR